MVTHSPAPVPLDTAADSQAVIDAEIGQVSAEYAASVREGGRVETQPRLDFPPYRSRLLRHPTNDLHHADPEGVGLWAPAFGHRDVGALEADLVGRPPRGDYLGATAAFVEAPLARAAAVLAQPLPDPTARPEETP